jgi:Flp pilus assembly pilin Flp
MWRDLIRGEEAQDLVEYSLLLAFIALVGAAVYIGMGRTENGLWTIVNSRLASANQASSS